MGDVKEVAMICEETQVRLEVDANREKDMLLSAV